MRQIVDLVIENATQLVTCHGPDGPKRGTAMRELGIINGGGLAIHNGEVVAVAGDTQTLHAAYAPIRTIDASGKVVCPGFVDPHTHMVYAGTRVGEFELRLQGASYLKILATGGGILHTMRATRVASADELLGAARARLDGILQLGTTTAEVKSGYGLDTANELKLMTVIAALDTTHPMDLVPTFLGAHTTPPEFEGRADAYVSLVVDEMMPQVAAWYRRSHFAEQHTPLYVDVFCEEHAFTVAQAQRVLSAGRAHGMRVKAHVDQFTRMGAVAMALDLDAVSLDHLDVSAENDIRRLAGSATVGVLLPAVTFHLGGCRFAPARAMVDAGMAIALATDYNPGSAPCRSLPFVMALACRYLRLLPAEALNACTINAAWALGLGHRIGSLEVGKQADLVMLDAADYRSLMYEFGGNPVETVIKRGVVAGAA